MIGPERPFCIIGERINPTGRKAFQAQLQAGDLSQLETDVAEQVAGGADMLDVNVGDPLADEIGLMANAVPMVQGLCELPLCIDSSVIEALEAGLSAYDGKALVNSVTGEDERLEAILPIVARHGAAVIGLANDDEIPMEPVMQLVCRDRNRLALEADIAGAALHGIENLCCLTGDDVTAGDEPEARRVFDLDSIQLIALAATMRNGRYLSGR